MIHNSNIFWIYFYLNQIDRAEICRDCPHCKTCIHRPSCFDNRVKPVRWTVDVTSHYEWWLLLFPQLVEVPLAGRSSPKPQPLRFSKLLLRSPTSRNPIAIRFRSSPLLDPIPPLPPISSSSGDGVGGGGEGGGGGEIGAGEEAAGGGIVSRLFGSEEWGLREEASVSVEGGGLCAREDEAEDAELAVDSSELHRSIRITRGALFLAIFFGHYCICGMIL